MLLKFAVPCILAVLAQVGQDEEGRIRISFVAEGSPAEREGVHVGDVLTTVNGIAVGDLKKESAPLVSPLFPTRKAHWSGVPDFSRSTPVRIYTYDSTN